MTYAVKSNDMTFDSFDDELEEEALDHMAIRDLASFEFYNGFINKSIDLSDDAEELRNDEDLDFTR